MPAVISLLRGINVGGHNQIRMDALRALYESLGLRGPQTYIQSGNVVFRSTERNQAQLARKIEDAIEKDFSFRPSVIHRTISELRAVIARNPFAGRPGLDPARLSVSFLATEPAPDARAKVLAMETAPEEVHITSREMYIYFPNGMARPKVPMAAIEKALRTPATARNWNTVAKLLEMAESL